MSIPILTFDPDGDLHLRLVYPSDTAPPKTKLALKPNLIPVRHGSDTSTDGLVLTPPGSVHGSTGLVEASCSDSAEAARKEVDMLVSSKHLMLSSPVFKVMLQRGNFLEGKKLESGGDVVVKLPEDDPSTFKILLDIVHGRVRQVLTQVSVQIMTGLSILVDKYQMHEVVELYVRTWMPEVKKSLPVKKDPTLLPWISISYVFRLSAVYQHVTRLAVLESCGPLGNDLKQLLPIPGHVFDRIERHRQNGIKSLLGALKTIVDRYNKNEGVCRSSYDRDENIMRQGCDSIWQARC